MELFPDMKKTLFERLRSSVLDEVREMPELSHWPGKRKGVEFSNERSEVMQWIKNNMGAQIWLFRTLVSYGEIVYDREKKVWRGAGPLKPENGRINRSGRPESGPSIGTVFNEVDGTSIRKLARTMQASTTTVWERLKKLEKMQLIRKREDGRWIKNLGAPHAWCSVCDQWGEHTWRTCPELERGDSSQTNTPPEPQKAHSANPGANGGHSGEES
jgi:hypothetical protein